MLISRKQLEVARKCKISLRICYLSFIIVLSKPQLITKLFQQICPTCAALAAWLLLFATVTYIRMSYLLQLNMHLAFASTCFCNKYVSGHFERAVTSRCRGILQIVIVYIIFFYFIDIIPTTLIN